MTNLEFVDKLILALHSNNIYVNGCFGAVLKGSQLKRYTDNSTNSYNKTHKDEIKLYATDHSPCFGFDCVGLIKGVLWGWKKNRLLTYGGASYQSNGVKDVSVKNFTLNYVKNKQVFEGKGKLGQVVWTKDFDHIAVYLGDGKILESTRYGNATIRIIDYKERKFDYIGDLSTIEYLW